MSGLAKFFVVINLVLALFFLGVSATLFQSQKNWKGAAESSKEEADNTLAKAEKMKEDLQGKIDVRQKNIDSLKMETEQLGTQVTQLHNSNGDLRKEGARLATRIDDMESRIAQKDEHIQDKDSNIGRLEDEISRLTTEIDAAGSAKKSAERLRNRALLDKEQLSQQNEALNKEITALREDFDNQKLLISRIVDSGIRLPDIGVITAPPIDGMVVGVQEGVVVLSVGKDDNVQIGYEFTIYDGNRFIGKVQVTKVLDDMSGCTILFEEDGNRISEGHKASTRLSS
ncbi:MAG: hypothetical protein VYD70_09370 [Planctomycetota bacterium]|nr:hypothetical protein [Planctomycetota bacterium]